jgi:glyoxylase-like metal-dependent hydrolase (beta-lactamase superfamily II)
MKRIADGIHQWSVFSADKQYDFCGLHLALDSGPVLIDPPPMSPEVAAAIDNLGAPARIYLTNKDHRRDAPAARERFGAPIAIHHLDRPLLDCAADETFDDGDLLGGALEVLRVPASKSPGESALYWRARDILILGDALIGNPPGALSMLPDAKFSDPALARREAARVVGALTPTMILVGDGVSILQDAPAALRTFAATAS